MKILLYKPDSPTAFRMYNHDTEVVIPKGEGIVNIIQKTSSIDPIVIEQFKLVRKQDPIWTDDTKSDEEIMVKLQVEELE